MPPTRRQFLRSSGTLAATLGACEIVVGEGTDDGPESFVLKSQAKPEPRVVLPTDALPPPAGPRKRLAAITTAYFKYSHADDIITKFIEGYAVVGRVHQPHCEVVSLYDRAVPRHRHRPGHGGAVRHPAVRLARGRR